MIVFGLDPAREPERAKIVHDSHLARARWMTESGYRHLLEPRFQLSSSAGSNCRPEVARRDEGRDAISRSSEQPRFSGS